MISVMTEHHLKEVLDQPPKRQEDTAQMLPALEARQGELCHPDDDEWAAIQEGFAQAKRGLAISTGEVAALFKQRGS